MNPTPKRGSIAFLLNSSDPIKDSQQCHPGPTTPSKMAADNDFDKLRTDINVPLNKLYVNATQTAELTNLYGTGLELTRHVFDSDAESQSRATALLKEHGLDVLTRQQLENKWNISWSCGWARGDDTISRVLVQCVCGYDTAARQKAYAAKQANGKQSKVWNRRAPYDFHECLAHADITYSKSTNEIQRIVGYLKHVDACSAAPMTRLPAIPLHPHVAEIAVEQLLTGASITTVQMKNSEMISIGGYRDQFQFDPSTSNHRYELLPTDFTALYRKYNRRIGIDISLAPEYNLDNWLNPLHMHFKPDLYQAVFLYCRRADQNERLKVCISTPDMDAAAWAYGSQNQIILDGTFGVCTTRLLLFIAMGVDAQGHGVPLALFLFSAPIGSRATHTGYNMEILTELLLKWRQHLDKQGHGVFEPAVAITDTDTKERGALVNVWPKIILLLCKFHVRQCWTNRRRKLLSSKEKSQSFWSEHVLSRLHTLENRLLETLEHSDAQALILAEQKVLEELIHSKTDTLLRKYATAGLAYLEYMRTTWLDPSIWASWSQFGRQRAADQLKKPISGVIPTTNHLESFNCVLKRKYIPQWQRSGSRLRFDVLIHHLVLKIIPELFARRRIQNEYDLWINERFKNVSGGQNLRSLLLRSTEEEKASAQITWYPEDTIREHKAKAILSKNRLVICASLRPYEIWASCAATSANIDDPAHLRYWLTIHPSGPATCTCKDWCDRGAACKHLRALRMLVIQSVAVGKLKSHLKFHFPMTSAEATTIMQRLKAWYSFYFPLAVTITPRKNPDQAASGLVLTGLSANPPSSMTTHLPSSTAPVHLDPPCEGIIGVAESLNNDMAFQNLVGEKTTLVLNDDTNHDEDTSDESGLDYAGNTIVEDLRNEHGIHQACYIFSQIVDLLITLLCCQENQRAIGLQVYQRLVQDINKVLPSLHGISTLLHDLQVSPESATNNTTTASNRILNDFRNVIQSLHSQIQDSLCTNALGTTATNTMPRILVANYHGTSHQQELLPPSPEPKQKRRKSYGVL